MLNKIYYLTKIYYYDFTEKIRSCISGVRLRFYCNEHECVSQIKTTEGLKDSGHLSNTPKTP